MADIAKVPAGRPLLLGSEAGQDGVEKNGSDQRIYHEILRCNEPGR
jgi:hypothetical protein